VPTSSLRRGSGARTLAQARGPASAGSRAAIGLQQTVLNSFSAVYPTLFGLVVAATTWRAGFALVALFPLAGYVVLRRVA
jgi:hypothetical protein